jgi:hypothetical protein
MGPKRDSTTGGYAILIVTGSRQVPEIEPRLPPTPEFFSPGMEPNLFWRIESLGSDRQVPICCITVFQLDPFGYWRFHAETLCGFGFGLLGGRP